MSTSFFNSQWELLASKEKAKYLKDALMGLVPAIVYLDDEEEALEIFELKCQELGIEAITAKEPEKLLSFIAKNKARILFILSDLKMPEISGFDFRDKVLPIAPDVPFVILSGFVDREIALQGIKYKIASFLNKPFKTSHFIDLLKSEGDARAQTIRDEYEMMKSFTDDVTNILEEAEEACLKLENDPNDSDTIARIFGLIHTVKGSSGFFEPKTLHQFAHAFEDLLKQIQNGSITLTTEQISVWLQALDTIKVLNNEFITGNHQDHDVDALKSIFNFMSSKKEVGEAEEKTHKQSGLKTEEKEHKPTDLKVSMQLLDEFMQTSGELTVIRNMINKVVRSIEAQHRGDKDVVVLGELLEEMHKINSDVQNKITDIRRVGVNQIVKPLARNIRDTCKALKKEIDFVVEGEALRVDNSIAEILSRSLIHLMRNSIDHGIESHDERKKSGKPFKGTLLLKFEEKNESVFVTIQDDGKGINLQKIKEKVLAQGLRSSAEIQKMSDQELSLMIFEAGFSTAAQITEFSGRGVGMSMVKDCVETADGRISVLTENGKGTKFILEIPIPKSVLITNCLFVTVGELCFGIPQEHIVKVFSPENLGDVKVDNVEGGNILRFGNRLVPILNLCSILNVKNEHSDKCKIIVFNANQRYFALKVSQVLDIEDAVIKSLNFNTMKQLSIYKGGTFMGDGSIGLILDVVGIANQFNLKANKTIEEKRETDKVLNFEKVILFETETKGTYAIPERDVYRVEVLDQSQVQTAGNSKVVPYRDSMLTLIDVEKVIFERSSNLVDGEKLPTIIVKVDKGYVGLVVKSVLDLLEIEVNLVPSLKKKFGIKGSTVHNNKTYTLVDFDELKKLVTLGDKELVEEEVISILGKTG